MDDATRKDPPPVGALITVKFFEVRARDGYVLAPCWLTHVFTDTISIAAHQGQQAALPHLQGRANRPVNVGARQPVNRMNKR
jgi:hypothetical protein